MTKIELMHKVLDVAMRINGGAVERNGAGHPTVFITYFGHINDVDVTVHENGWSREHPEYDRRFEFDFGKDVSLLEKTLKEFREYAFALRYRRSKKRKEP